ncbi:hypothetical protein [Pedobacter sp. JCM 36344]|uniref:hypothetical protein n=1 Tax=Pedobacter sp. JCM 36344 TaxID=3374280 RepID=UPI00397B75A5
MNIRELLLNGQSFLEMLKQFSIEANNFKIQDEDIILNEPSFGTREIVKESICIEGKNNEGIVNFFGTLHYNLLSKLAVFEMQGFEQIRHPNAA